MASHQPSGRECHIDHHPSVKILAQTMKRHDDDLIDIKRTLSQIGADVSEMKSSRGRLSSQTLPNRKGGASSSTQQRYRNLR